MGNCIDPVKQALELETVDSMRGRIHQTLSGVVPSTASLNLQLPKEMGPVTRTHFRDEETEARLPDQESLTSNSGLSDPRHFPGCDTSGVTRARPGIQPALAPEGGSLSEPTVREPRRQTRQGMGCWAAALAGVQAVCRPWPGERRAR